MDGFSVHDLNLRDLHLPAELLPPTVPDLSQPRILTPYEKLAVRLALFHPNQVNNLNVMRVSDLILMPYSPIRTAGFAGLIDYLERYGNQIQKMIVVDDEFVAAKLEATPEIFGAYTVVSPLDRNLSTPEELSQFVRTLFEEKRRQNKGTVPPIMVILQGRRIVPFLAGFGGFPVPTMVRPYSDYLYMPGDPELNYTDTQDQADEPEV